MNAQPVTRAQGIRETLHGVAVSDPFRWLEDEKSTEVRGWVQAQDAFAREKLNALPGRAALKKRLTELLALDAVGIPVKRGGRYFYSRQRKDQEKAMVVWKEGDGEEKVLLDPNSWSKDNTLSLGTWVPSWDGKKVAFCERPNAADEATLFVLDVETGQRSVIDVIRGAKYASPSWSRDSKSFVYAWLPDDPSISVADRPGYTELRQHVLGQNPATDAVLHPKLGRADVFLNGNLSDDGQFLFVVKSHGWSENSIWFKRVGRDTDFTLLIEGHDANYEVEAYQNRFYVLTDEGAPNKQVFVVDPHKPSRQQWRLIVPQDPRAARQSLSVVGGHLAISSLQKAVSHIEVFRLDGHKVRDVELPGLGTASNLMGASDDDEAFASFSSLVQPPQILKSNVRTGQTAVWAKVEVPIDPSKFEVKQLSFASKDGTPVSMFVVAPKGVKLDGNNPTVLGGYGGFGVSITSDFRGVAYPWLEAGGVFALVNLRGGGEYGKAWHDAGKLATKQNVFDDFAAAARFLVAQGYTSPKRLGIRGRSNGGLLMGAAMTQHPELYGAVVCGVPLLDMLRYHLSGSGMTWTPEYGNPEKPEEFKVLEAYSPYHHVADGVTYPPLLMMSSDHDDRVDPLHARKFVARVQQAEGGRGTAWLRIEVAAGHTGADQISKAVEAGVDEWSFFAQMLGSVH